MKIRLLIISICIGLIAGIAFAEDWLIDYGNVSDPVRLQTLLENRMGGLTGSKLTFPSGASGNNQYISGATARAFTFNDGYSTAEDLTLTFSSNALAVTSSTGVVTINLGTIAVTRTAQQYSQSIAGCKAGTTAGWVVNVGNNVSLATLPQSQTGSTLIVPVTIPLKIGCTITAFSVNGQIDSAGNTVTLDADLRKITEATAGYTDASVGAITQISKTADYKVIDSKSGLTEVVAADETFYVLLTATTGETCDIEIAGITVTITEN